MWDWSATDPVNLILAAVAVAGVLGTAFAWLWRRPLDRMTFQVGASQAQTNLAETINSLIESVAALEVSKRTLRLELAELREENAQLRAENAELKSEWHQLKQQLDGTRSEGEKLEQENLILLARVGELEREGHELRAENAELRAHIERLEQHVRHLEERLDQGVSASTLSLSLHRAKKPKSPEEDPGDHPGGDT